MMQRKLRREWEKQAAVMFGLLFVMCLIHSKVNAQSVDVRLYYPDSSLRAEGARLDGLKEGKWRHYYPDGTRSAELKYQDDSLHGEQRYYGFTGELIAKEQYRREVLSGRAV
ncbi:MAG: hypothetical protein WBH03_04065, partial [Cyclobacteriaceae bacterium]